MLRFSSWKITFICLVVLLGFACAAPNFFSKATLEGIPGWLPRNQIVLGLDLQGGSYLLLEAGTDKLVEERLETLRADVRKALRQQRDPRIRFRIRQRTESVDIVLKDAAQRSQAIEVLDTLSGYVDSPSFMGGVPEKDILIEEQGDSVISLSYSPAARRAMTQSAIEQSIEVIRRRIDELGTTEPTIQRQGEARIIVEVPGLQDPERLKALLGKTAKLTFRLVDQNMSAAQALASRGPSDAQILYSRETEPPTPVLVKKRIIVGGENLVDAQASFDQRTNEPVVTFRFDTVGAKKFGDVTRENVGRPFAIVLDEEVISYPVINEPILGGSGQISGNFTVKETVDLALLLRAGRLPVPLSILEERTVGPGLGADSVAAGRIAAMTGFAAVIIYIALSYGLFGIFANVALVINIALIAAVLSVLQGTLTLPGIAGIVLTMGMAVDANVLIFERIREEIAAGKLPVTAIENGYAKALTTIMDANITTFIAAGILFQMGSGPVRGFAVTLAIGILTSVFTAFTVTRLMIARWYQLRRPEHIEL